MSIPALALTLVRALPASLALPLARLLILLWLSSSPASRTEIRRNYRVVFGRDRPGFWVENAWQVGRNLALMARMDSRRFRILLDKAEISGDNSYRQFEEMNMHAIMVSFHYGLWELLPRIFRRRGNLVVLAVGAQRDPVLDRMLRALRARDGVRLLRSAVDLIRFFRPEPPGPPGEPSSGAAGDRFGRYCPTDRKALTGFMLDNTSRGEKTSARAGAVRMEVPGLAFRLAEMNAEGRRRRAARPLPSDSEVPTSGFSCPVGVMPLFCTLEKGRLRVRVYPPGGPDHVLACLLEEVRRRPSDWVFWGKAGALTLRAG